MGRRRGRSAQRGSTPHRPVESALVAVLSAVLSFAGGILAWRADLAGGNAAAYDRQGIVEAVKFQGEAERAETDARTEQRTFAAYAVARIEQSANEAMGSSDAAAAVEAVAQRRLADRLERGFPADFVRWGTEERYADATFDTTSRAAELLREREVRDDSPRLFALATEEKDRRQALRAAALVLILGLAATALGQLSTDRRYTLAGVAGGCLTLGYAAAVLATAGA
ncbi:MAG TPA: hypothetical protein VNQ77_03905 [Frankiaceae bacterium]|nr:hypothetical protein [Frankiaceae bacterium]